MATPSRDFHDARFFLLVDGVPYFFSEESAPVYVHARGRGDLTTGEFGLKINGQQVFQQGTGFTDNAFRDLGCFDVSQMLKNQSTITLEGFSVGVASGGGYTNHLQVHFVHPFGEPASPASASSAQLYDFTPLETGTTPITKEGKPRSSSVCLTKRGLSLGNAQIDLQTYAQTGFSLQARLTDPTSMLADIFTTRKEPYLYCIANTSAAESVFGPGAATPNLNKGITADDSGALWYAGAEAIFVGDFIPATLSVNVERGAYGTTPEIITGYETMGQDFYLSVPGFTGRRAQLWVGYKMPNPEVKTSSTGAFLSLPNMGWESFEQIGTFRVEDAPESLGMGAFNLQLSDLSTFFANRKAMVNCRAVEARSAGTIASESMVMKIEQPDGEKLEKAAAPTVVLVKSKAVYNPSGDHRSETDLIGIFPFTYSSTQIEIFLPDMLGLFDWGQANQYGGTNRPHQIHLSEAKQVFPIVGDPIHGILTVLESSAGTLTTGPYDTLPGNPEPADFYEESYRMGAAINSNDIDEASFTSLEGFSLPWSYFLGDELEIRDLLRWLCISTRCCWFVTSAGKLTMKTFDLVTRLTDTGALIEIDENDILRKTEDKGQTSEKMVASSFKIETNYSVDGKPTLTVNFTDFQTLKKYPSADNVTSFEMPFLQSENTTQMRHFNRYSTLSPVSLNDLELVIRRRMKMNEKGIFTTEIDVPWRFIGIELGDKIRLLSPDLFNYETPTQNSLGLFFVTGKKMSINEGIITLALVALQTGRSFCQAGEILSYNAGTKTITFSATSGEWNAEVSGGDPSAFFAPGMAIRVYDESASAMLDEVVDSLDGALSIVLQGVPSATYVAGDVVMIEQFGDNASGPSIFADPEAQGVFSATLGVYPTGDAGSRMN